MRISHPESGEQLEGLALPEMDPEWVWVMRDDRDRVVAYLATMYGHKIMMLMTLRKVSAAPPLWALVLLRAAMREAQTRGCQVFMSWLDMNEDPCKQLHDICIARGGRPVSMSGEVMAGRLEWFLES